MEEEGGGEWSQEGGGRIVRQLEDMMLLSLLIFFLASIMSSHVPNGQRHSCGHCQKSFPTSSSVRRHIAHSQRCRQALHAPGVSVGIPGARTEHQAHWLDENTDTDIPPHDPGPVVTDADIPPRDPGPVWEGQERGGDSENNREDRVSYFPRYAQEFAAPVAEILGIGTTIFDRFRALQDASGGSAYAPFADQGEWELAEWLISNANQRATEEFLKLSVVSE